MSHLQLAPEWRTNRACWLAWPWLADEWLGDLHQPRLGVAELARAIAGASDAADAADVAGAERIEMLVTDQQGEDSARGYLGDLAVRFHYMPYGDIWLRDTGPIFAERDGRRVAVCFQWNGWGGKYMFEHDAHVAERIAGATDAATDATIERHDFVLEGGALDWDGQGTALTTRQCLLADNRSGGRALDPTVVERRLADALGIERVIWLDRGLLNDHTDGHVDTLARFVAKGRVLCMRAHEADDANRSALDDIARDLRAARDAGGQALEVVEIPSPGRVIGPDGELMPASYVNFYLGNTTVVVPVYGTIYDHQAVDGIARLFPERRVVGVDARAILVGGGAFHCITKQEPA